MVGPNGAGKTSLLHALASIGPARGQVSIEGRPLARMSPTERIGKLGFLPASRDVAWPIRVRDLVALGLGGKGDEDRVRSCLRSLEAEQLIDRRLDELSTGERTRVLLARALISAPAVLLLDEPEAHLDPVRQLDLLDRLKREARAGAAVLASVHDLTLARTYADRVLVIEKGLIVADGPPADALAPAVVRRVFGVEWTDGAGWTRA